MSQTGGCYCGEMKYEGQGDVFMKAQCHCRECQYISGGGPNYFMVLAEDGFAYTSGTPKAFKRSDLENPVTREFCPTCGTHMITRLPGRGMVVVKVGTLDDPSEFGGPAAAIYTCDQQSFHMIPEGLPAFEKGPPRK